LKKAGGVLPLLPTMRQKLKYYFKRKDLIMSTENYRGYKFRYVKDNKSKGKVKVYVEKGGNSKTKHMYKERFAPLYLL